MTEPSGLYEGDPEELANSIVEVDVQAGTIAYGLAGMEQNYHETHGESGWDVPYMIGVLLRRFPDDRFSGVLRKRGAEVQLLQFVALNIGELFDDAPLPVGLMMLGTMISEDPDFLPHLLGDKGGPILADARWDVVAWIALAKAWRVDDDAPKEIENRMVAAVDRVGYRYQLARERASNETIMQIDLRITDDPEMGIGGLVPDALSALMDVTPTEI